VITVTGSPTGGTFTLKYRGQETGTIAYNDSAANVQTALRALSNIGSTGVSVSGSGGGPWTVTFAGPLANTDVFTLQLGTNSLTGGTSPSVTIAQSVMGLTYDPRIMVGSADKPGTIVTQVSGSNPKKVKEFTAAGGVAEVQTLTVTGTPTGGTFALNYKGSVTAAIAYNASAAAVASALNALDSFTEDGGVVGSGGALPGTAVVLTFNRKASQPTITVQTNALTGGTSPAAAVAETTAGADEETIYGIIDGTEEFISNDASGSRDVAVYVGYLVLDCRKIKNFSTYQAELTDWAARNFCRLEHTS